MESLDVLNLRAGECSFLEIALVDVRSYVATYVTQDKKQVVLVFPPLSPRNRFLIHTLVQHFFYELSTISIGNSYGRRTVVYHSSLKPMIHEIELEESNMIHDENDLCMNRAYRTPSERKAQEKLFQSLMPKKKVDKITRSTQRKQSKRPDIPIYVPKALRGLANNTIPNISNTTNSSNATSTSKLVAVPIIEDGVTLHLKEKNVSSSSSQDLNSQQEDNIIQTLASYNHVDLKNEMLVDKIDLVPQSSFDDVSYQISEFSNCTSDSENLKKLSIDSSVSNESIENKSLFLGSNNRSDSKIEHIDLSICDNAINPSLPDSGSKNTCCNFSQNCTPVDLSNLQESVINNDVKIVDNIEITNNKNVIDTFFKQECEICLEDEIVDSNTLDVELDTDNEKCLEDSFTSEILTNKEENNSNTIDKELTIQQSSESVNKSLEIVENNEKKSIKKKKKKKKVLDVDECSWEDLYDKEDDYIHPLLMKELISSMGKVQVKCAKEDYRSHQTIEERSGDGECVIEVYGFSSELKTIDLMNQFAAFRKQKLEIVWVDDTHALAVFESPHLADRALNTPFTLVKTRPLKNAIRESKLKAETVAPLPATRPKTCSAMARRLVSSALGLKVNVSPDLLNAERTLLANAKEKKIRDAQQKNDIWNES